PPLKKQWNSLVERLKEMKVLLPGMILQTTAAGMLVPILPSFATKTLGLTYTQYSLILILGGTSAVLGLIPMGKFSDRGGKKWFLVIGFALFAICLASLTFSTNLYSSIAIAILLGVSYSAVLPAWNAILSYQVPEGQEGLGWGIFSSVEGIGIMIGPIVGGGIGSLYGENVTVWLSAILLGGIALFYLLLPFHRVIGKRGTYITTGERGL
ncbi:MAG TPA: MFS transporter, partial [Paenibacillaceae bacterium]|nr:MFS transporter [Paenibacillaceae bacterium]